MEEPLAMAHDDVAPGDTDLPSALANRLQEVRSTQEASPIAELPPPDTERFQPAAPAVAPRYDSLRLSQVRAERVRWLWPRRWPQGKLVTLDGDPDVGKSMLCCDLAAHITTGRPLPGERRSWLPASDVVFMTAEDGLADTVRPRLEAAEGDIERVHYLRSVPVYKEGRLEGSRPPMLPTDVAALEELIIDVGAVLVVVDVLMAYLAEHINSWSDHGMRRALAPLAEMAERTGACVVLVRHFPKSQRHAGAPLAAGSGSMGIIGLARAGMVAGLDPTDPDGQRRVLARSKGNLAGHWRSLAYRIHNAQGAPVVEWLGETNVTSAQLLGPVPSEEERSGLDEVTEWVLVVLAQASGGPIQFRDLLEMATKEGYSRGQLYRVRQRLLEAKQLLVERDKTASGAPATWSLQVRETGNT